MKLLAFDTGTEACTAALWLDGRVYERFELGIRHAERLLPMVEELLAEAGASLTQLDAVAFGRGPGSFTGLRIGAGVAQGLAFGADVPVVPVSSLAALAQGADAPKVLAAFDARMQQVYYGAYIRRGDVVVLEGAEVVAAPELVPLADGAGWIGTGSGWDTYADALMARNPATVARWLPRQYPQARHVAQLASVYAAAGQLLAPEQALPIYIRDDVAMKRSRS